MNRAPIAATVAAVTLTFTGAAATTTGASATTPTDKAGGGYAIVQYKSPSPSALRIPRSGRCLLPKFVYKIVTNYPDSMFNGGSKLTSRGKTYGAFRNPRLAVNRDQTVQMLKPICTPGTYTLTVTGKVTSSYPIDGQTYETYERVRDSRTYIVTKAH